jgi:tetratricopeptide (TPR) repeat protein
MSDELANNTGSVQTSSNEKVKIMGPIPSTGLRETLVQIASLAIPQATLRVISPDINGQISICNGQTIVGARFTKRPEDGLPALRQILGATRGMFALVEPDQNFQFGQPLDVSLNDILEWRDLRDPQSIPTISQAVNAFDSPQDHEVADQNSLAPVPEVALHTQEPGNKDAVQVLLGIMEDEPMPPSIVQGVARKPSQEVPATISHSIPPESEHIDEPAYEEAQPPADVQEPAYIGEPQPPAYFEDPQEPPAYFEEPQEPPIYFMAPEEPQQQPAYFEEPQEPPIYFVAPEEPQQQSAYLDEPQEPPIYFVAPEEPQQQQPAYFEEPQQPPYFEEQQPPSTLSASMQPQPMQPQPVSQLNWDIELPSLLNQSASGATPAAMAQSEPPNVVPPLNDARTSQQIQFSLEEARQIHEERLRQNPQIADPGSSNPEWGQNEINGMPADWGRSDLDAIATPKVTAQMPTPAPATEAPSSGPRTTGQWDLGALDSIRAPAVDSQTTSQRLSSSQPIRDTKGFLKQQPTTGKAARKGGSSSAGRMIILSIGMSVTLLGAMYMWANQLMQDGRNAQNFQLGLAFLKDNNGELASQKLTAFIEKNPNNVEARFARAKAYSLIKEWSKAADDFSFVLKEKPQDLAALNGRATAYLRMQQYENSVADATEVLKSDKNDLTALQVRSEAYLGAGQFKESVQDANNIIELKPADGLAQAYAQRAFANMKEKKYKEAIADYSLSLEKDSKLAASYANRAQCHFQLKQYDKAIADCDNALFWSKLDTSTYLLRAECFNQTQRYAEALKDLDKAVALQPGVETYGARAKALITVGNFTNAVQDLERIMKFRVPHPAEYDGLLEMCYLKVKRRGGGETAEAPTPVVKPTGTFEEMVHQGYELMQQGNGTDAVIWLNAALKEKPQDVKARSYLAHALLSAGNPRESAHQFLWIAKVRTLTLDERIGHYKALQAMGEPQQANAALAALARENPNNNVVRFYIVRDLVAKGDREAAAEQCRIGIAKASSPEDAAPFQEILQRLEKSFAEAKARKK